MHLICIHSVAFTKNNLCVIAICNSTVEGSAFGNNLYRLNLFARLAYCNSSSFNARKILQNPAEHCKTLVLLCAVESFV